MRHLTCLVVFGLLGGIAFAEPQTLSFYSEGCTANGSCDFAPSVPPQGFVLTDIISGYQGTQVGLSIKEVVGQTATNKVDIYSMGFHLTSGIPFVGGSTIRLVVTDNATANLLRLTFVGYIPGTTASSVPAVSGLGLTVFALLVLAAGGYVLRRSSIRSTEIPD